MNKKTILKQIQLILDDNVYSKYHQITAMANISALLFEEMKDINWIGFYLVENTELVLGPFQGPVACTRIGFGKGVCGTSWKQQQTIVVENVHDFPGHIACSSASKSEIVVPVFKDDKVCAVLDIDSEYLATFDDVDKEWLEKICCQIKDVFPVGC